MIFTQVVKKYKGHEKALLNIFPCKFQLMPKVISFISRKGGTGKTTNAINIATALSEMGNDVVLIESDINYSLREIRKQELSETENRNVKMPDMEQTEEIGVVKMIKDFKASWKYDFIIVDTAANITEYGINRLSVHSDMVIVPTSLSMSDVMVTELTLKNILPALEENKSLKVALLPNRIHVLTGHETVNETLKHLKQLNVPVLDTIIPNLKLYTYISTIKTAEGYPEAAGNLLKLFVGERTAAESGA